jgi:hypothetical protein
MPRSAVFDVFPIQGEFGTTSFRGRVTVHRQRVTDPPLMEVWIMEGAVVRISHLVIDEEKPSLNWPKYPRFGFPCVLDYQDGRLVRATRSHHQNVGLVGWHAWDMLADGTLLYSQYNCMAETIVAVERHRGGERIFDFDAGLRDDMKWRSHLELADGDTTHRLNQEDGVPVTYEKEE